MTYAINDFAINEGGAINGGETPSLPNFDEIAIECTATFETRVFADMTATWEQQFEVRDAAWELAFEAAI